jgi:hypothetical protein
MMPTYLPKQLEYLAPALSKLSTMDPETLNEDNIEAAHAVEAAVRQRIRGMDEEKAQNTVQEDSTALKEWLEQPELANSPGHFIFGLMFGMSMWADFGALTDETP